MARVTVSRVMPAPQAQVWALISDVANATRWNNSWSSIELTSQQTHGVGTAFRAHTKDGLAFDFVVTDWVSPEYISFTPIREKSERYAITLESHSFRLTPGGEDETLMELTAHASGHGVKGRVGIMFFWAGHQKQGLEMALDSLEEVFAGPEEPAARGEPAPEESPPAK